MNNEKNVYNKLFDCGSGWRTRDICKTKINGDTDNYEGYLYGVLASVVVYIVLNLCIRIPLYFDWSRSQINKEEEVSGEWIETVIKNDIKYYTFLNILYLWNENKYIIEGVALNQEGEIHANWRSSYLEFDTINHEVKFIYYAQQNEEAPILGYAEISFFNVKDGIIDDGRGFFVDMLTKPIRVKYKIERIDGKLKNKLLGNDFAKLTNDNRKEFVKEYHNRETAT